MRILALDVSKRASGFAVDGPGDRPLTGTWGVPARCACHGEDGLEFMRWLRVTIGGHAPDMLAIEAPYVAGGGGGQMATTRDTLISLTGLFYAANVVAAERCIRVAAAVPATVRKHFVGSGHAKKPDVQARCRMLGWTFADDNQADALALWSWAKASFDKGYRAHRETALFAKASAA